MSDFLLNEKAAADLTGHSTRTYQRWRVTGEGPAFVRVGPRKVAYRRSDIDAWLNSRTFQSRAAELAQENNL